MEEEWTEQIFIDHVVKYINQRNFSSIGRQGYISKLIRDKEHRRRILIEKENIVIEEIDILTKMLNWEDIRFKEEGNE